MKDNKFVVVLLFIFVYTIFLTPVQFTNAFDNGTTQGSVYGYEELLEKAFAKGRVKVIIELNVPNVAELTEDSRKFTGRETGKESSRSRIRADTLLATAIGSVVNSVVDRLNGAEYRINHTYSTIPFLALDVSAEALSVLRSLPEVLDIVEDIPIKFNRDEENVKGPLENPFTGDEPEPPYLNNTVNLIGADVAWGYGCTGCNWYVAILDTGIRPTHEMFAGKTIVEACFSASNDCPNGGTQMYGSGAAAHYYDYSSAGAYDHGTHVAGIAAGNSGTLFGVAKDADIIAVQVFSRFSGAANCGSNPICVKSYNSDQLKGLEYVYSIRGIYRIAAVNMSIGGGKYSSYCDANSRKTAIDNLAAVGIATVISTGNDGYCGFIGSPACISSAVAVGATTDADVETSFSNWDDLLVDLFAPGYQVYSATAASDSSYESWNGTSMAAPHVTGAWAVLKQCNPSGTVNSTLNAIKSTGKLVSTRCPAPPGYKPRVQVDSALVSLGVTGPGLYVDPSGWCGGKRPCYRTIQEAIDAACCEERTCIKIKEGCYNENIVLNTTKEITLDGGWNAAFTSQSSNTIVKRLTRIGGTFFINRVATQQ